MASNPTIQERVFYFDGEGSEDGIIDVASSRLFEQAVVQRAQLINLSTTGRGLPSILPEYNRINVQYPRSHTVAVTQGGYTYTAGVAGHLRVINIDTNPTFFNFNIQSLIFEADHGLNTAKFFSDNVAWSSQTITVDKNEAIDFDNITSYRVFYVLGGQTYWVGIAGIVEIADNKFEITYTGDPVINANDFVIIAKPVTEALDGAFVGIADTNNDSINVNSGTIDNGVVPDNTFVGFSPNELLAFNFTGQPGAQMPTLVQTPLFIDDAVTVLNARLQSRWGSSAPVLAVRNNALVSTSGGTVSANTLTRSAAMITIPDYYYDNNFNLLGASIGADMNRLFIPSVAETNMANAVVLNGQTISIAPGKYASPESFAKHLSAQLGATYVVKVLRTSGSKSYSDGEESEETETLPASLDTQPTFRVRGQRADTTSAVPYRPRAYQFKITGPAYHQLNLSTTSSYIRTILGLSPGAYAFDVTGSIQRDSRTRGTCSVSILQAPKRFNIALQNNSFTMKDATIVTEDTLMRLRTKNGGNEIACGLSVGEVVNVRFNNTVVRAVVQTFDPNTLLSDFDFSLVLAKADFDLLGSNAAGSDTFTITRVDGNRAKFDVSGYPLYQLMSPAPLVGLTSTTIINGSTLLPRPFSAFSPSYIIRLIASAEGFEPRSNPQPITLTEGRTVTDMPYGYVRGGTSWLGGSVNLPLTLITPTRLASLKVLVTFPDKTPVDLSGEYFTGVASVSGQDRLAHFAVQDKRLQDL